MRTEPPTPRRFTDSDPLRPRLPTLGPDFERQPIDPYQATYGGTNGTASIDHVDDQHGRNDDACDNVGQPPTRVDIEARAPPSTAEIEDQERETDADADYRHRLHLGVQPR